MKRDYQSKLLVVLAAWHLLYFKGLEASEPTSISCKKGHWPIHQHCDIKQASICYNPVLNVMASPSNLPPSAQTLWNIFKITDNSEEPQNKTWIPCSVLTLLQYDRALFGSTGANYYIFIVDVLLPVWNYLRKMRCQPNVTPVIVIFAYTNGTARIHSEAFSDPTMFWNEIGSLLWGPQIIFASPENLRLAAPSGSSLCFDTVSLGAPELSDPPTRVVQAFAAEIRQVRSILYMSGCVPGKKNCLLINFIRKRSLEL